MQDKEEYLVKLKWRAGSFKVGGKQKQGERAGTYVLYAREKWFSILPEYQGLMTEVTQRSFKNKLAGSLHWKANRDLKDQVGSRSTHCDIGFPDTVGSRQCWEHTRSYCPSLAGITTWKSVHCPAPWSKQVQDARENVPLTSQGHHVPDTSLKQLNMRSSAWSNYWRTEENLPSEWQNRHQRRHLQAGATG